MYRTRSHIYYLVAILSVVSLVHDGHSLTKPGNECNQQDVNVLLNRRLKGHCPNNIEVVLGNDEIIIRENLEDERYSYSGAVNKYMTFIKGGCFQMGDFSGDGLPDEKPVHKVCVNDFFMSAYPVTQGLWKKIMEKNPSAFKSCGDDCPVDGVSWNEAQEFINRLNKKTGQKYRLPTEAEWEYAARSGGNNEKWAGTSSESELADYAWYGADSDFTMHKVGKKKPNGLGLYDMSGNVWQWVSDWYGDNYYNKSPRDNPQGPHTGTARVLRGGSWVDPPWLVRTSYRSRSDPSGANFYYYIGFRLALSARSESNKGHGSGPEISMDLPK